MCVTRKSRAPKSRTEPARPDNKFEDFGHFVSFVFTKFLGGVANGIKAMKQSLNIRSCWFLQNYVENS